MVVHVNGMDSAECLDRDKGVKLEQRPYFSDDA